MTAGAERAQGEGGGARATAALFVRPLGSFAAALLTCVVAGNGLIFPLYAADLQIGVLGGIVAGVLGTSVVTAAGAAAAGALVAGIVQAPGYAPSLGSLATTVLAAVVVAALARAGLDTGQVRRSLIVGVALVMVAANLWLTASVVGPLRLNSGTTPSEFEVIAIRPQRGVLSGDSGFFRNVVWRMRDGTEYYAAYRAAWFETWKTDPSSIFGVRQPTLFAIWAALPGWPRSAFFALLLVATLAIGCAPLVSMRTVSPAVSVFGAAAIGAYLLRFVLEPGLLFLSEQWVGALAVAVFAAFALAQDDARHRRWIATAAIVALFAMTIRELMLYLLLAGLLAAVLSRGRHRRFDIGVWAAALVGGLVFWGVHAVRTNEVFAHRTASAQAWFGNAGLANLLHGVTDATVLISAHPWIPAGLAVMGVAGALAQRDPQYRLFASAAVLMPLVGFLFLGNGAVDLNSSTAVNTWGAIVMPALLALAPATFALVPGLRAEPMVVRATVSEQAAAPVADAQGEAS